MGANNELNNIYTEYYQGRIEKLKDVFYELSSAFSDIPEGVINIAQKRDEHISITRWHQKVADIKTAIAFQMEGTAMLLEHLKKDMQKAKRVDAHIEKEICLQLKAIKVILIEILEIQENGFPKVLMKVKSKKGRSVATREIASIISDVYAQDYVLDENCKSIINDQESILIFKKDSNFNILMGYAGSKSDNQYVSGDNYTEFCTDMCAYGILSDGMGNGYSASRESEGVVELAEELITAGFSKEMAVSIINTVLVAKTDESEFTTVDLCEVNLFTGMVEFLKLGAAPSYIKRQSMVEVICPATLPAGVENQFEIQKITKKIYDGDLIIMMSDGVIDSFYGKEQGEVTDWILEYDGNSPKELAKILLEKARENAENCKDDMSILVMGVWYR